MNTIIRLGGTDWNDAVNAHSIRGAQIKGEIVAHPSACFGFDLRVTFPCYQGQCRPANPESVVNAESIGERF